MPASTASPRSSRLAEGVALCLALASPGWGEDRATLPVFLADNHAETFAWMARTVDLDAPHLLVLIDAHSDASAAERSEELREEVRRVPSVEERMARIERWREGGRLQAFNWLEPLLPRPVERVLWIAAPQCSDAGLAGLNREAWAHLDGRLEVEPRAAGSFAHRWETRDLIGLAGWNPGPSPVMLSVDLDFFAGMDRADREATFESIWARAMDWEGLRGVAFSVSRPWLADDGEAAELVGLALDAVARTRGARLEIDASLDDRPDDSLKARSFKAEGIPRWDLGSAPASLRSRLLALEPRLLLRDRKRDWTGILPEWRASPGLARIRPEVGEVDLDGVWRFPVGEEPVLRVHPAPEATGRVRWFRLFPARPTYDLIPETGLGKDFSKSPARWIHEVRRPLGESTDFLLDPSRWRDPEGGRIRLSAEYETAEGWLPTETVELRLGRGMGFRGALSECFGMPYVFGVGGIAEGDLDGVEGGWGSDCANLLIHAWRRQGIPLAWGDPGFLRRQLSTKVEDATIDDRIPLTRQEIEEGVAVDFGRHVAALWEDLEPLGILDGSDRVVHHLGGFPEIVRLSELAATRPVFALRVPRFRSGLRLALAGDVVLSGEGSVALPGFGRGEADLFLANLEGVPSMREPAEPVRFDFRFPPGRLSFFQQHGVHAVSLANNHALDAGPDGLVEGLEALRSAGLPAFGAGRDEAEACRPWRTECRGLGLAVFGVCLLPGNEAGTDTPGVANLPRHRSALAEEMRGARIRGERIVVLVHGGEEYRSQVDELQRRWARWLVARGAVVVSGSHPHVVQREERHGGAIILHSLGNAVYPPALKGADSGKVKVVELP